MPNPQTLTLKCSKIQHSLRPSITTRGENARQPSRQGSPSKGRCPAKTGLRKPLHTRHEWILCRLAFHPKVSHYVCENVAKSRMWMTSRLTQSLRGWLPLKKHHVFIPRLQSQCHLRYDFQKMAGYEVENGKPAGNPSYQLGSCCNNDGAGQKRSALWATGPSEI